MFEKEKHLKRKRLTIEKNNNNWIERSQKGVCFCGCFKHGRQTDENHHKNRNDSLRTVHDDEYRHDIVGRC